MKRLAFVLIAFAFVAFAQTYVRPSKGVPIPAFPYDGGYTLHNNATPLTTLFVTGTQYEWTAFEGALVRLTATGTQRDGGTACATTIKQFWVKDLNTVMRARLRSTYNIVTSQRGWTLEFQDSPGAFNLSATSQYFVQSPNASVALDDFYGCALTVTVTPMAFAPATIPVLGAMMDGGSASVVVVDNLYADVVDSNNTVSAYTVGAPPAWASATWTGTERSTLGYSSVLVELTSNRTSATNGFCVQWSRDGVTWDISQCETVVANIPVKHRYPVIAAYYRLSFTSKALTAGTSISTTATLKIDGAPSATSYACSSFFQSSYLMDGGIITLGVAPTARWYTVVCNSRDNSSGNVRCRADADAGVLVTTAGSIGDVLAVGDCITYTNNVTAPINCIGSGTWVTANECAP